MFRRTLNQRCGYPEEDPNLPVGRRLSTLIPGRTLFSLPGASVIPPSSTKKKKLTREVNTRSPEARETARKLGCLALSWTLQKQRLLVREREELRRAVASAADFMGWRLIVDDDPVEVARKDILKLSRSGARVLTKELADETAEKKAEITQLKKSIRALQKMATEEAFEEPVEFNYDHTARKPSQGLVTKTETLELTTPTEAGDAANAIENKLETWGKLREEMLIVLKGRDEDLDEMKSSLAAFAKDSEPLIRHVLATLH